MTFFSPVSLHCERLVDRHADGVRALRRRDDALGLGELHRRREGLKLLHRARLESSRASWQRLTSGDMP